MNKVSLLMAALGLAASSIPTRIKGVDDKKPMNLGRRAEKDRIAIAKAEAKRQRKAAKAAALLRKES